MRWRYSLAASNASYSASRSMVSPAPIRGLSRSSAAAALKPRSAPGACTAVVRGVVSAGETAGSERECVPPSCPSPETESSSSLVLAASVRTSEERDAGGGGTLASAVGAGGAGGAGGGSVNTGRGPQRGGGGGWGLVTVGGGGGVCGRAPEGGGPVGELAAVGGGGGGSRLPVVGGGGTLPAADGRTSWARGDSEDGAAGNVGDVPGASTAASGRPTATPPAPPHTSATAACASSSTNCMYPASWQAAKSSLARSSTCRASGADLEVTARSRLRSPAFESATRVESGRVRYSKSSL